MTAQKIERETHPASSALIRSLTRLVQKRVQEWAFTSSLICPCKEEPVPRKTKRGQPRKHVGKPWRITCTPFSLFCYYGTGTASEEDTAVLTWRIVPARLFEEPLMLPARRSPVWRIVPARFLGEALRSRETMVPARHTEKSLVFHAASPTSGNCTGPIFRGSVTVSSRGLFYLERCTDTASHPFTILHNSYSLIPRRGGKILYFVRRFLLRVGRVWLVKSRLESGKTITFFTV